MQTAAGQADGLTVDAAGGVWVALGVGAGLARYTPDAQLDFVLPVPASFVSACRHFGDDLRELAITTAGNGLDPGRGGTVFTVRVDIPGHPIPPATV
ncbi:SMP-30/gluconolactonase/LRE family protein [Actinoplanes sp. CA-030573]|uniref:SMP-30/gluconolactonase/LRE family protein n=1 Tax=Actinoplanes sp. CA-030573 TaxID=3239898 RepID=UPI003D8A37CD